MKQLTVGILLFDEVEVLDFAGPFEVFSLASALDSGEKCFNVITISEKDELLSARNGLKVKSDYLLTNHPKLDIAIIPGGKGAEEIEIHNPEVISWIREQKKSVTVMASVCTGALLLAQAGLLDGRKATTHWMDTQRLEQEFPEVEVLRGVKYVDEADIVTSGGISAGINMSFHLVSRFCGQETARQTAKRMEYDIDI
ncbi:MULTISPECIES: DJ-1/PfpI family protein [unclassified Paenibacillus]|uniref:DJ-1/PfpI family protein n=1 Tax=unclassified Paenibacillus TaxID=185978 RepID=UPI000895C2F7|nr:MULTISPECIES: DJ-1/PfpI family protein [unclassified Paenibacillus]OMC65390.1 AraC family transcriptional regulator [Paenibacillus sp. FSL H7-0326]SDX18710.1 DJ-1/PfpI family protein [Paenibacillus sp. PDC88]